MLVPVFVGTKEKDGYSVKMFFHSDKSDTRYPALITHVCSTWEDVGAFATKIQKVLIEDGGGFWEKYGGTVEDYQETVVTSDGEKRTPLDIAIETEELSLNMVIVEYIERNPTAL